MKTPWQKSMATDARSWVRHLILVAAACASGAALAEDEADVLRVAVYENFEPYSCTADSGEGLFGVDVEIAQALAKRLDRRAEVYTIVADDTMDEDLEQLDPPGLDKWGQPVERAVPHVLMHVPQDPRFAQRNAEYRFTAPYYFESMAVIYDREGLGSLPDQVDTAAPFRDARIGVELYTLSYTFATNGFSGQLRDNTRTYDKLSEAVVGLMQGDVEAVFAPRTELQSLLAKQGADASRFAIAEVVNLFRTDRVRSSWDVGVSVRADNEALAEAVEEAMQAMRTDGTVKRILAKYGIPEVAPIGTLSGADGEIAGQAKPGRHMVMLPSEQAAALPNCPGGATAGLL